MIAIDTKDVIEALNQIEVNQGSKREKLTKNIGETSGEMTDEKIDGRKSGLKEGKKDATIDVTTIEAREVGRVIGTQIVNETIAIVIDPQIAEIDSTTGKRMVKVVTTIALKVKSVQMSSNKISPGLLLKSSNPTTGLQMLRETKAKYQP